MIDPALFENLITEIHNQYGPLNDDQNPSQEYFEMQNEKNPEGEKTMRRKLFELVRDIPHFRDLIQISQKSGKFEQLCQKMTFRKFSKGDILFKQFSVARELILIVDGKLSMWQLKSDPDINNEQKLIQASEKALKAYKREEAKQQLEQIRDLEEDGIFHIVAQRNAKRLQMQKLRRGINTQTTQNFDLTHTNTFVVEKNGNQLSQASTIYNDKINANPNFNISQVNTNTGTIANFVDNQSVLITAEENRYFKTDNICKYKRSHYHGPGDFLGEKEALSNDRIDYLGVAYTDQVLAFTIPTDTYLSMFDLESAKTEFIVKCLQQQFPTAKHESLLRIAYDFKSQSYDYNQPIFHLRERADKIYIVKSGLVEVGQDNLIKLALLGEGQLLGFEDCITEEKYRNFKATSKSGETLLFYIESQLFAEIVEKTYDGNLKRALVQTTQNKLNYYNQSTSKIQDLFSQAAGKKKNTNSDDPITKFMTGNLKNQQKQNNNNNSFLDGAYKSQIAQKNEIQIKKDANLSSEEAIPPQNHNSNMMTTKYKSLNNIKSESALDETSHRPYMPTSQRKISDQEQQYQQSSSLVLPNVHLNANSNPQKRVQIMLDCFDQKQKHQHKIHADRMSERKVKSLANIPDDEDDEVQPVTERERQLQNIEKNSNKNILKSMDRAIDFKREVLNKRPKPVSTEKEDTFQSVYKFQKARYHSVFTTKKPGLPFKQRQYENLQKNLQQYAHENLISRKTDTNIVDEDNETTQRYPQSSIYYNDLDENNSGYAQTMPIKSKKQYDRPTSLQHIDVDYESLNNSVNNIHVQSMNKLSPLKSLKRGHKNNLGIFNSNSTKSKQSYGLSGSRANVHSTPFVKNIFQNDVSSISANNDNDLTTQTVVLPKIAPFFSQKKVSENSYLDTTNQNIPQIIQTKSKGKFLDFEGVFAPKGLGVSSSARSVNTSGVSSLGVGINSTRSHHKDSYNSESRDQSYNVSPVKVSPIKQQYKLSSELEQNS